ncbi:serine/threonine-protein kinase [Pseudactinotalea sp. HY158]|uniref:serine/threonine-protein kinase n=1 Tax=Pseudactinotalea sp. HY158 TaxID=2654547 RepID=UPI00129C5268|nr:serine/threonine-protein kinase [Pseudactinotalea sp. HY158]QGH69547.1 protein kinase [Pseudactinotalea sp. HY158]
MSRRRPTSTPPTLAGHTYEQLIGTGGFSDVFRYRQHLPSRLVAVKVLLTDATDAQARHQFVAEANLMAQLSAHPSIVTIHHADIASDNRPYLVMEYCPRPNLAARYKSERIAVPEALRIGIRLAGAVETAHRAGILHRDIKPANVLTTDYGWPALTDFGISVAAQVPDDIATGMSIPWAAPEFFDDDTPRGPGGDTYALAATIYTIIAGRSPFERPGGPNTALDLMARIQRDPVPELAGPDVPVALDTVLRRAMAKRAGDRFASVAEFGRSLQRIEEELHLAHTPLDLPDTSRLVSEADEDQRTRARPIRSISAAASPATARGFAPAGGSQAQQPTRARGVPAIDPAADAPVTPDAPPPPAGGRRRRWPAYAVSAGIVVAVVAVAVSGVLGSPDAPATPEPTLAPPTVEHVPAPDPPSDLRATDVEENADGGAAVTFAWTAAPGYTGDYVWQVVGTNESARIDEPTLAIDRESGSVVCIEVASVNDRGVLSRFEQACG